jgi:hypothetical protein
VIANEPWPMYVWAAAVALAVLAAGWTARTRPSVRPELPLEHVAGAAIVGLVGWELLVYLPGSLMGYWTMTAGLGEVRGGVEAHQAFLVGQVVFVIGAGFAIVGIIRRRPWGAVLGIGLAAAMAVYSVLQLVEITILFGASMQPDAYLETIATMIGTREIPALAAIALLAWPLLRRRTRGVISSGHEAAQPEPGR